MNCERIREQIPELLADRLAPEERTPVMAHLEACPACRAQADELRVVWRGLHEMQEAEPGPALRSRFLETLSAWQDGFREGRSTREHEPAVRPVRAAQWWWAAAAALLLAAGAVGGRLLPPTRGDSHAELAQLRGQVDSLRQLVALSLLQEQSPGSRLRGVAYSYSLVRPDRDVQQALLRAVNHDSNVNVRLAAVDALAAFSESPEVRRALADGLPLQDSPLVQVALVDLLARVDAREASPALQRLARNAGTNEIVRQRAAAVLEKWGGVQ